MTYSYEYPHPAVTVDVIVFTVEEERLKVLLIRRGQEPFKGQWAIPGGFVGIDESLKRAAWRELKEETGVRAALLQQLGAFGRPDRDPRERIITVAYYALVAREKLTFRAGSDADDARLFALSDLPVLASDHGKILQRAAERLRQQLQDVTVPLQLLPTEFTMAQLQQVHECILGRKLDKRNFRKKMKSSGLFEATGEQRRTGSHRPAALYRVTRSANVLLR